MDDFLEYLIVTDQLGDDDDEAYFNQVNEFWINIQNDDSFSQKTKDRVYELCNKLVREKSKFKRDIMIKEIESLTKK